MPNKYSNHIFTQIPNIVLNHPELSSNDKIILVILYDVIKDKGNTKHRNRTISLKAGLSERTVARSLNKLERLGFIVRRGLSFTRQFFLGMAFKLSKAIYTKIKQCEKILHRRDKSAGKLRQGGIYNKNLPTRDKERLTLEDMQMLKWYKNNPWANIKASDQYLFG